MKGCLHHCKCKNCKNPLSILKRALNIADLNAFTGDFCLQQAIQNMTEGALNTILKAVVQVASILPMLSFFQAKF